MVVEFQHHNAHMLWWVLCNVQDDTTHELLLRLEADPCVEIEQLGISDLFTALRAVRAFAPTDTTDEFYRLELESILTPLTTDPHLRV